MSAESQLSVISLAKIKAHKRLQQIRLARMMMVKHDSTATTSSETELIEDSPPSYSTVLHTHAQDVDETSTKESVLEFNIITSQPRGNSSDSFELSTRSSLQSAKLSMDAQLLSRQSPKRPVNNAWNENIVIRNIYSRDQSRLLCFCVSALGGITALAFYCTSTV